jgi:peptide/nickel transport system permease protein
MARQVASEAAPEARISLDQASPQVVGRSLGQLVWRRLRRDRYAIAGATYLVILTILALGAGLIVRFVVHHGPNQLFIDSGTTASGIPRGADSHFWFGHDKLGRDVLVRVLYGARTSLLVAVVATGLSMIIGVGLGMLAGFYRGWVDTVVSRSIDVMMSLPILLLAIGLAAVCGADKKGCVGGLIQPGLPMVIAIIGLVNWTYIARIIRGQVLSLRERQFVESARSLGASGSRIMFRELLPNLAMPIIVYSTLIIPANILFEASLSFLGVGVDPSTPSWGAMIASATDSALYEVSPWLMIYPGLFLFLTTFAFNLVGDGLRDALDPQTAK